jgi:hypothetical protein
MSASLGLTWAFGDGWRRQELDFRFIPFMSLFERGLELIVFMKIWSDELMMEMRYNVEHRVLHTIFARLTARLYNGYDLWLHPIPPTHFLFNGDYGDISYASMP